MNQKKKIPYDAVGDIAILKFSPDAKKNFKLEYSKKFLKQNRAFKTVLEKTGKFSGILRKAKTRFIAGENKKETIHIESGCRFFLNVDDTYFSPRLCNERKLIAEEIAKKAGENSKILVMFAGVAPFPIIIAKKLREKNKEAEIISNELNRRANKYAAKNILINKVADYVKILPGDCRKLPEKLTRKFDFIVMPRPNLKETFLQTAEKLSKKGTRIYYYGFGEKEKVLYEVKKNKKLKSKKIMIRKAGEIAPYKFRWLAVFKI